MSWPHALLSLQELRYIRKLERYPEDGRDREGCLGLWPFSPTTPAGCLYSWDYGTYKDFNGLKSSGQVQPATKKTQFSPFRCWLLEGKNIRFHARVKRLRLWNLRIPFLTHPSLTVKSCGATHYFEVLFLSLVPHSVWTAAYAVAVIGMNNTCQEFRGN